LVRLKHFLVLFVALGRDEEVVVAALQVDFDMDVMTNYLAVTFDKILSMTEKDVCYNH
jgi:hypothetical protein